MKRLALIFTGWLTLIACSEEEAPQTLVQLKPELFSLYAPVLEAALEQKNPCNTPPCLNTYSLEIVAIDTAKADSQCVYAWCWKQALQGKDDAVYKAEGELLAAKILLKKDGRNLNMLSYWMHDAEDGLKSQLKNQHFPEVVMDTYFLGQSGEVEKIRTAYLEEKAVQKFKMLTEGSYKP